MTGTDWVVRGATAYYRSEQTPLKICSEPHLFNGQLIVVATKMAKNKESRVQGMYAVSALKQFPDKAE